MIFYFYFVAKILHFGIFLKQSQATWSRQLFVNFQKKSPHFQEKSFEITKNFGGFAQISHFLFMKSPYLANRSNGSTVCNDILRFSTFLFVL